MSTSTEPSLAPVRPLSTARPTVAMAAVLVVIAAHVPLVSLYMAELGSWPAYRFAPLLLIAVLLLAARRVSQVESLTPGSARVAWALVLVDLALLAGASLIASPTGGMIAALVLALAAIYAAGGRSLTVRLLPVWAVAWLVVRPPWEAAQTALDSVALWFATAVHNLLDGFQILHAMDGSVIELPAERLAAARAAGVELDLALLALACVWLLWRERGRWHAALLLTAAVVEIIGINVLTGFAAATLASLGYTAVAVGAGRLALVGAGAALTMLIIGSTDQLLLLFQRAARLKYLERTRRKAKAKAQPEIKVGTAPVTGLMLTSDGQLVRVEQEAPAREVVRPLVARWRRALLAPVQTVSAGVLALARTCLGSGWIATAYALAIVAQMALALGSSAAWRLPLNTDSMALASMLEQDGWRPVQPSEDERADEPLFAGSRSRWLVTKGDLVIELAVRYGNAVGCDPASPYRQQGWLVDSSASTKDAVDVAKQNAGKKDTGNATSRGEVESVQFLKPPRVAFGRLWLMTLNTNGAKAAQLSAVDWTETIETASANLAELGQFWRTPDESPRARRSPVVAEAFFSGYAPPSAQQTDEIERLLRNVAKTLSGTVVDKLAAQTAREAEGRR